MSASIAAPAKMLASAHRQKLFQGPAYRTPAHGWTASVPLPQQGSPCSAPARGRVVLAKSAEVPPSLGLADIAALDQLIDLLLAASNAEDLTEKVAQNMLSFDQRFWLRLATRTDTAGSEEEREKLSALAKVVMQLVDAMVRKTNEQLTDSAGVLQEILLAAADERTGEWSLPLSPEALAGMRAAMEARADQLDEALLSNCFAWMRKASDDKLDGMVAILQKVLQLYAARALSAGKQSGAAVDPADEIVAELLAEEEAAWAPTLRAHAQSGRCSEVSFLEALQRRMEAVVLSLASGSYAQRVQAEYLKELESRAKQVFADLAAGR